MRIFGRGANLLIADEGIGGIVVRLDQPAFRNVSYNPTGEIYDMHAMAGADLARTLMDTVHRGFAGLSPATPLAIAARPSGPSWQPSRPNLDVESYDRLSF